MNKIFVISGNNAEAKHWQYDNLKKRINAGNIHASTLDYVYVDDVIRLRGIRDPHGVFIGTWESRVDIREIVDQLCMSSSTISPTLRKIHDELKAKIKPTPKLRGQTATQVYVDEAAALMAKEIDAQVLRSLGRPAINVFCNGVMQSPSDYMVSGSTVTLSNPSPEIVEFTVQGLGGDIVRAMVAPHSNYSINCPGVI